MAARRSFLLRVDAEVLDQVQRWANDELRSLNGHIEFLLRASLKASGRLPKAKERGARAADVTDSAKDLDEPEHEA